MKNPDWNEGHCQSLPALLFGTLRTLADIRTEDAKYHGSNLNYKLDKRSLAGSSGRRSTLACMLLFCVAGARLWKHDARVCNTHATHSQHNTQHEHFSCKFSMNVRISRGWPGIRSLNANIRFLHTTHVLIENLQEKCSCCVLCWLCVACVLHVSCMAGPRNTGIVLPKPSTCHAKEQHACQSAAPATNTSEASFVQFAIQIATMIFCIFCPNASQCPERTKKVVLAETDNVLRFSPGEIFLFQYSTTSSLQDEVVECWNKKSSPGSSKKTAMPPDKLLTVVAPSNPHFKVATEKGWTYLTWMAVFSEGRWGQPERNNFEVGGHGGIPRLNLQFYRMAVFYEEPGIMDVEIRFLPLKSWQLCPSSETSNILQPDKLFIPQAS